MVNWKLDTNSKRFIHYVREDELAVISINFRPISETWGFSFFPIGTNNVDKYYNKENLTKSEALRLAKNIINKISD